MQMSHAQWRLQTFEMGGGAKGESGSEEMAVLLLRSSSGVMAIQLSMLGQTRLFHPGDNPSGMLVAYSLFSASVQVSELQIKIPVVIGWVCSSQRNEM